MQTSTFRKFRAIFIAILVTAMTNYAISFATTVDFASEDATVQVDDMRGQDSSNPKPPPKPTFPDRGQDSSNPKPPPKPTFPD